MSMAQSFSPHLAAMAPHAGMPQGHPMTTGHPPNPNQVVVSHAPGQVVQQQQMHGMVSGPGSVQASQGGAAMGGIPTAVSTGAGVGPSAHALSHLNPGQAHLLQQQQLIASNPQLYHHQIMRHRQAQAAQQALLQSQQNGGGPVGMPHGAAAGGMAGPNAVINASRLAAMQNQAGLRTVNLPDHMQQQQLAAQAAAAAAQQQQQQQQQQHHQQQQYQMQHQHLLAQQAAVQQANAAAAAQGRAHGQPGPLGAQQQMQMMQSPQAIAAAQQQAHVQAQQQAQAHAQAQVQAQAHAAAHQSHPGASAMMQPRAANPLKGRFLLQMMQFADHLSNFADLSWGNDLAYWQKFVDQFFSQSGILRQQLLCQADSSSKQYEISTSALPRYYCTHFESGVRKIQMILENAREREVPNHCHYVESPKASFIYWFESGSQLVSSGTLRAQFDHDSKIDVLEFVTTNHCEYLSRHRLKALLAPHSPPEDKSPKQNKAAKARAARQQQPPPPPPPPAVAPVLPVVPESHVNPYGVTPAVLNFLELAETISHMQPLFQFSQQHAELTPSEALSELVATFQSQSQFGGTPMIMPQNHAFQMAGQHQQHQHQQHPQHPQHHQHQHLPPSVVGTPHMVPQSLAGAAMVHQLSVGASPSQAHLALPGSPHTMSHPSPGQNGVNAMQAPGLVAQHSQQGTNSSSQGTSANTSPNASNKRRRASGVKVEADDPGGGGGGSVMEMNGGGGGGPGGGAANANGGAAGGTAGGANPGAGAAGAAGAGGGGGASTGVTAAAAAASKVKPSPRLGGGGGGGAGGGNKKQKAGAAAAAAAAAHA